MLYQIPISSLDKGDDMTVYLIPQVNIEKLANKLEILNRKAVKTQSPLVTYTVGEKVVKYYNKDGDQLPEDRKENAFRTKTIFNVDVIGVSPKFEGWSFVGTLDYTENGNVFRCMPGKEIPEKFRNVKPVCDHCKTKRSRKDTFILAHDDGRHIQVGRQCLRDFLGHTSPERIAFLCQFLLELRSMEEESLGRGDSWSYPSIEYVVSQTVAIVKRYGWVSRHHDEVEQHSTPTTSRVWQHLIFSRKDWEKAEETPVAISEQDIIDAQIICDWIKAQNNTDNQFIRNLWIVFQEETVSRKNVGLVAAAFKAHEKATTAPKKYETEQKYESVYVGEIGKREIFKLTVLGSSVIEKDYGFRGIGFTTVIRFKDEAGNRLVWFASGDHTEFEKYKTYTVKATVKKHDEYKDKKQTIVNRVAIVEV